MPATPAIQQRGGSLGPWILAPLAAVAPIVAVATQLPHPRVCGDGPGGDPAAVAFVVLTGLAILTAFALGVWRAALLIRRNGKLGRVARLVIAWLVLALAALVAGIVSGAAPVLAVLFLSTLIVGSALTFFSLFGLLDAMSEGVRVDEAGVELPAYLFGFALFAYPFVFLVAWLIAYSCFPN